MAAAACARRPTPLSATPGAAPSAFPFVSAQRLHADCMPTQAMLQRRERWLYSFIAKLLADEAAAYALLAAGSAEPSAATERSILDHSPGL